MNIVSLIAYRENQTQIARDRERRLKLWWQRRYINHRIHMAFIRHTCNHCILTIEPGEMYERCVYGTDLRRPNGKKYLIILKYHYPCCYGPTEDDMRDVERRHEAERRAEKATESLVA